MDKQRARKKVVGTTIFALVVAVISLTGFGLAQAAKGNSQAQNNGQGQGVGHSYGNVRPGNGFGDTNHVHTGPPGQQ